MMKRDDFLAALTRVRSDEVVVTTMGAVRPWGRLGHHELDFASADSAMGHAADLALGIALARPERRVVCVNGDGSMLMCLGTLVTAVDARARNYVLFVLNNGTYEITGNQSVPGAATIDWLALARGAGFKRAERLERAATVEADVLALLDGEGPVLAEVVVGAEEEGPISRSPRETAPYLQCSIADSAWALRQALARDSRSQCVTDG